MEVVVIVLTEAVDLVVGSWQPDAAQSRQAASVTLTKTLSYPGCRFVHTCTCTFDERIILM